MTVSERTLSTVTRPSRLQRIKESLSILWQSKVAVAGLILVLFWALAAILAPAVTTYKPNTEDAQAINQSPSASHWLGTDHKGRDLWSRVAYGGRIVLVMWPITDSFWIPGGVAIWGVLIALAVGSTLGLMSGYYGGWIDEVVMRILDAMMAFPTILLYLIIIAAVGASATNVVIAITIAGAPGVARLVRSLALDIRTRDYIAAAETRGESGLWMMFVEILPNARGPIIIDAMLRVGYAIFSIGTLGFLGLGLPPPNPDWGSMVQAGHHYIFNNPWGVIWPTVAISSLVVGLNLLADGLREESLRYQ
ncbi:MAG: Glutathione transport system permease protein GsiD [Anaerolineales bacterium]|nr:Glutathione transport system permease protein GsiD [Anaerolineales bacterium]